MSFFTLIQEHSFTCSYLHNNNKKLLLKKTIRNNYEISNPRELITNCYKRNHHEKMINKWEKFHHNFICFQLLSDPKKNDEKGCGKKWGKKQFVCLLLLYPPSTLLNHQISNFWYREILT